MEETEKENGKEDSNNVKGSKKRPAPKQNKNPPKKQKMNSSISSNDNEVCFFFIFLNLYHEYHISYHE